jgi:drug/metabolite transporter (DMT)-like permease
MSPTAPAFNILYALICCERTDKTTPIAFARTAVATSCTIGMRNRRRFGRLPLALPAVAGQTDAMTADRPVLGILLMLGFCVLAPLGDGMAKLLGASVPLLVLVAVRFLLQGLLLLPLMATGGRRFAMSRRVATLTVIRTLLHIAGLGCMFLALQYLPLADAVAIAFVMPFIMLLLGWFFLGEEVGPRRIAACAVGFAGTLLVVQPSFAAVGAPALLPLAVAVVFALFMLTTRAIAREVDPISLQCVSGLLASIVLLPLLLVFDGSGHPRLDPTIPSARDAALLLALGVLGTIAHLLMTWSLRFAPTSTVAPMQYLEIPFATAIGLLMFGEFPNGLALAGIAVTVAAGLYIILRERSVSRKAPPTPAPAPPAA